MSLIKALNSGSRDQVLKVISEARAQGNDKLHALTEERNKLGESPLIIAIKKKFGNIAQIIMEIDDNLNYAVPKTGDTALMYASKNGQKQTVLKLIEMGSDISIRNLDNKTASDIAIENNYPDCAPSNTKKGNELAHKLELLKIDKYEESKEENKDLTQKAYELTSNSMPPIAPYEDVIPLSGKVNLEDGDS